MDILEAPSLNSTNNTLLAHIPLLLVLAISPAQHLMVNSGKATIAIYILSRAQGVPDRTLEAVDLIQALLKTARREGAVTNTSTTTIGIEGEQQICIGFPTEEDARKITEQIRKIIAGVELINLKTGKC